MVCRQTEGKKTYWNGPGVGPPTCAGQDVRTHPPVSPPTHPPGMTIGSPFGGGATARDDIFKKNRKRRRFEPSGIKTATKRFQVLAFLPHLLFTLPIPMNRGYGMPPWEVVGRAEPRWSGLREIRIGRASCRCVGDHGPVEPLRGGARCTALPGTWPPMRRPSLRWAAVGATSDSPGRLPMSGGGGTLGLTSVSPGWTSGAEIKVSLQNSLAGGCTWTFCWKAKHRQNE